MRQKNISKHIPPHEWFILTSVLGFILMVGAFSWISSQNADKILLGAKFSEEIKITIEGAVKRPGVYEFESGFPLKKIFKKAGLDRLSDLKGFDLEERVFDSTTFFIPTLKSLTINLKGAVCKPGLVEVPINTRICNLIKLFDLKKNADVSFFKKKRRYVKDQEEILIPECLE